MITQNLHTHCSFCDGKNTMEEMIQAAVKSGLTSLGFSSHSNSGLPIYLGEMTVEKQEKYFEEFNRLKEKYNNQIELFAGFEVESRTATGKVFIDPRCNYTIGSVHLFEKNGQIFSVDHNVEIFNQARDAFGSYKGAIENYFEELLNFSESSAFDIVGHFDLVTKFIERGIEDFTSEKWYRDMSLWFLEQIAKTGKIFEINTGAIGRGYRTFPYPSFFLIERLHKLGTPIVVNSDAHSVQGINTAFDLCENILKEAGFKYIFRLTKNGFKPVQLTF